MYLSYKVNSNLSVNLDNGYLLIGNFSYVQVQTGEQDDVARSSDDEAKGPEAEELAEGQDIVFANFF